MKTVIAEKPSVAREIASLLGASEKCEGYFSGNGYQVTWALGHLIGLAMPEDYGISGFDKSSLPILPDPFLLTVRKVKNDKVYKVDSGLVKQLRVIDKLFRNSESIIVATDAGREGELIFRYIYEYLKCKIPFKRLWISSLTEKAIREGFESLQPGNNFTRLYESARARSRADWLIGINATQALSLAVGDGMYSLGRVQTPTLGLICKRYLENKDFKIQQYWQLELYHVHQFISFKSVSVHKWDKEKDAENILQTILKNRITANINSVDFKIINEQPPLLFDLTDLQKEANKRLDLSAEETLSIAQSLYEKQFITYPRTGSKYISEDVWEEIPNLVRSLREREMLEKAVASMKWNGFNKRIVNDLRVTDHHGLLITGKIPSALSVKENAVYDMIAFRMLESLCEICIKEVCDLKLEVLHHDFTARGCKVIQAGWRMIKGDFSGDETSVIQELPELRVNDEIKIKEAVIAGKKTQPPKLYTEGGLLFAMETAGKELKVKEEFKALQNIGIGTPATRSVIIETLLARDYIVREKKSLIPTEKGLMVYNLVKDMKIADVAMTAKWELAFQKIENGEEMPDRFQKEMEVYASAVTNELLQTTIMGEDVPHLICPKCKKEHLVIRDRIVKCPDAECNWMQFRQVCGVKLSLSDIESLVNKRKTTLIKSLKSNSGKKFNACIVLNDNAESLFEFEK
ncbi:DNA topoisomerase III [Elizabethkingia anophelis]|uniref:type IA DNA topoisomerase n=1 Tax=Elizabethkingia anophelis TaxID=1117645 RepID=UPI00137178EA|nr:type IA DNA topoisomerase [Elizabethkingia anophelis]MCT3788216.1 topoisomerase C-terminal repeat-containing protein [Elizabethkingia anophelis]MCT4124810.1 topoisomerase C-terminal repeat-containing protein [Elizabethkingia anophelis]MCT4206738.1 topoisomerase C-terminal repeat-containing protein [Elizabethkingia anophelis]MCT4210252.1 topoisomerase C-terminal repeat-containing protein [Elizabethkingia anophelis]MDV3490781.1 DNA topoisomerase III [Elizabethkingia anophelis]